MQEGMDLRNMLTVLGGWLKAEDGEIEESRVPHRPPAETGIIAQKHSRTTAKHLLDGSAIPGTETQRQIIHVPWTYFTVF